MINNKEKVILNLTLKPIGKVIKREFNDVEIEDICREYEEEQRINEWQKRLKEII